MKFFRNYLEVAFAICVLALFVGCSSPLQQASKLEMTDPQSAIATYEQIMAEKAGSSAAQQAHLGIARTYYERIEDQQKGLEVYEEVAKAYPKTEVSGSANWAIADHYFKAKEYEKARENFRKVTEDVPGTERSANAAYAIARIYEESKKYDEAANAYKEFSASHPKHKYAPQAGLSAAKSYEMAGKNEEAIEAYKVVVKQHSFSSSGREAQDTLTGMGVDVSELIEIPEAEPEPAQTTSQPRSRRRRVRASNAPRDEFGRVQPSGEDQAPRKTVSADFGVDAAELMPVGMSGDSQGTMYDAMFMMANMNLQMKDYNRAGALYEKSLQLVGNKSWDNAGNAYFGLAKSYRGIGRNDKATEMFREAIKRDRKMIDRMIITGQTYYGDEEYEEAIAAYDTALGLAPHKDSDIYYNLGLVYQKLGDADKEMDAFERSVALKPNATDAVQHLAEVLYYRKKNSVRADLYDKEVRGQGNTDYKIQKELGDLCYKYAVIFSKEPDREAQSEKCYSWSKIKYGNAARLINKAIVDQFKKIIDFGDEIEAKQITPNDEKLALKLVAESAASGNQLAAEALQKSEAILAESRLIGSRIVICQARMNQLKQAQDQVVKLKDADPNISNSADFHLALGEIELLQGNKEAGMAEIKKALEINPEHKEAAERLKEVEAQEAAPVEVAG